MRPSLYLDPGYHLMVLLFPKASRGSGRPAFQSAVHASRVYDHPASPAHYPGGRAVAGCLG